MEIGCVKEPGIDGIDMKNHKIKKILFVSQEGGVNGSTTSLISLIKGIRQNQNVDIDITVATPWMPGKDQPAREAFDTEKIKHVEMLYRINYKSINKRNTLLEYMYDVWNFMAVGLMGCYIKRNKFDVICSNSVSVDVGARAAKLTKTRHVYYVREFMEEDHGLEFRNKRRMKKMLEFSDYIIFISKAIERKYMSQYMLKKTGQFYDDIEVKRYYVSNHDTFMKEKIFIVQVGVFSEGKGTLNSIQMMHMLHKAGIDMFHLEFVGDGDKYIEHRMREKIAKYELQNYITISPYEKDVITKLSNADILLMNSRCEGFGRVTVEGMLAGCLVLGRNNAGTAEIVRDKINGFMYRNEQDFVGLIEYIIFNRKKARMIAKCGQNWAVNEFSSGKCAQCFCQFVFDW